MPKIFKTAKAKKDLKGIWRYTLNNWGIEQADGYLMELDQAIKGLLHDPKIGMIYEHRKGYRGLSAKNHIVFYRLKAGNIEIVRVLHKRMDLNREVSL